MTHSKSMKHYLVSLHGQNLLIKLRGDLGKYGFRTKRYIEAANEDQAEKRALRLIFNDPDLHRIILNEEDDPPSIMAEEICEIDRPIEEDYKEIKMNYYKENETSSLKEGRGEEGAKRSTESGDGIDDYDEE